MFLRHSVIYLFARGLPGLVALIAITIYSRLLTPEDYGLYALVIAGVGLADVIAFQWLRLGLFRFLPSYESRLEVFLSTVSAGFLIVAILCSVLAGATLGVIDDSTRRGLLLLGVALLVTKAVLANLLVLAQIQLLPVRVALIACSSAVLGLAVAVALIVLGWSVWGLLCGSLTGGLITALVGLAGPSRWIRLRSSEPAILHQMFVYGVPLSVTLGLTFVVDSSDRFLIAWLLDEAAVGRYSAGYHLAQASIGILLTIINTAGYPLVVRALEKQGPDEARRQLRQNLTALLALGLPATLGFALLADNIASVFLGEAFRAEATRIMPLIALAVLLSRLKVFYFDLSFQLGCKTVGQIWVALAAAAVNIVLNLLWIPRFGPHRRRLRHVGRLRSRAVGQRDLWLADLSTPQARSRGGQARSRHLRHGSGALAPRQSPWPRGAHASGRRRRRGIRLRALVYQRCRTPALLAAPPPRSGQEIALVTTFAPVGSPGTRAREFLAFLKTIEAKRAGRT